MKRPAQMTATQAAAHQAAQQIYLQRAQSQAAMQAQVMKYMAYHGLGQNSFATGGTNAAMYQNTMAATSSGLAGQYVSMVAQTQASTPVVYPPLWSQGVGHPPIPVFDDSKLPPTYNIADGHPTLLRFPDGTTIDVKADGSFTIEDKDAKVTYRANRVRDFNSFMNASDKLEAFIKFCGEAGVRQGEMLNISIRHFIAWLVVEAAKADGEEPQTALPDLRPRHRCSCGRFLARRLVERRIAFCRPVCLERELAA